MERIPLSLSLSLSLVNSLFSLFARRKFINFARKFSQEFTKFTQNSNKFINSVSLRTSRKAKCGNPLSKVDFYGLPRSRKRLLAMTSGRKFIKFTRKFTTFINFHFYGLPRLAFARLAMTAISTPNAFKILKNLTLKDKQ